MSSSEAETHSREFLKSLRQRGLHGVKYVVSDDHDGLKAALNATMPGTLGQRYQCHLQRNGARYAPKVKMRKRVHNDIQDIFNTSDRQQAEERLKFYVTKYEKAAGRLNMRKNLGEQ